MIDVQKSKQSFGKMWQVLLLISGCKRGDAYHHVHMCNFVPSTVLDKHLRENEKLTTYRQRVDSSEGNGLLSVNGEENLVIWTHRH